MSARSSARSQPPPTNEENPGAAARVLSHDHRARRAGAGPRGEAYVARLRRAEPDATPAEIVTKLEKRYLARRDGQRGGCRLGRGLSRHRHDGRAVGRRRRDRGVPGGDGAVRAGRGRSARHPGRARANAAARWCWRCWSVRTASARSPTWSARAGPGARGSVTTRRDAAAAGGVATELPAAALLRQALHAQARGDRVRQAAAGGHRRGRRRGRQPDDGQADHRQRPQAFGSAAAALAGRRCTCCPRTRGSRRQNRDRSIRRGMVCAR